MLASDGPFVVKEFISIVSFTVPSRFISIMCTVPRLEPPVPSCSAPEAMSGTPSPSRSPTDVTEVPKLSRALRDGPFAVKELIFTVSFTVPSGFISITWTEPLPRPPLLSLIAPAAMSGVPSPSRSPMPATDSPKEPEFVRLGPLGVLEVPLISIVLFMVPSGRISITWTTP